MGFDRSGASWYAPAEGRRDRLSLALWPPGADPVEPEFVEVRGQVVAVVIVWPTDERGMLVEPFEVEAARVLPWAVSERVLARLSEVHRTWHLARHDVWVCGTRPLTITPCPRSVVRGAGEQLDPLRRRAVHLCESLLLGSVAPVSDQPGDHRLQRRPGVEDG